SIHDARCFERRCSGWSDAGRIEIAAFLGADLVRSASIGPCTRVGPFCPTLNALKEPASVRFEVSRTVDRDQWQAVADSCEYATFFHTPWWPMPFLAADSSMRDRTLTFRFEDGEIGRAHV